MPRIYVIKPSHSWCVARLFLKESYRYLDLIKKNIETSHLDMSTHIGQVGSWPLLPVYGNLCLEYALHALETLKKGKKIKNIIDKEQWNNMYCKSPDYHDRKDGYEKEYLRKNQEWYLILAKAIEKVKLELENFAFFENKKEWIDLFNATGRRDSVRSFISDNFWTIDESDYWIATS